VQVVAGATDYPLQPGLPPQQPAYDPASFGGPDSTGRLGEAARASLAKATSSMKRYGWIGFWVQLTLSVVSAVILLFSVAFTSQVCGRGVSECLEAAAIMLLAYGICKWWVWRCQQGVMHSLATESIGRG